MKAAIGRVLRYGIRKARQVVERFDPVSYSGNFSNQDFIYASINDTLAKFMSQDPRVLRPSYTWGVLQGAHLAKTLGIKRVSVIEFGVAAGNGLVALERASEKIEAFLGVEIDVHGFDTGRGLPKPTDYRDLPNQYSESKYVMDVAALRNRLRNAQLHIGLVGTTVPDFLASRPAPIAFLSFDLDFYCSTVEAFNVLDADENLLLPRVHCYFDDIMGFTCSEFTGERLAINEFNSKHPRRKISPIYGLKYFLSPAYAVEQWSEMFYLAHFFDHPLYGKTDGLTRITEHSLVPTGVHGATKS